GVALFAAPATKDKRTMEVVLRPPPCLFRPAGRNAKATPAAFGRCDAMVLVCGGTHKDRLPQTLCRPCEIGSSAEAQNESRVSKIGSTPGRLRERDAINAPER